MVLDVWLSVRYNTQFANEKKMLYGSIVTLSALDALSVNCLSDLLSLETEVNVDTDRGQCKIEASSFTSVEEIKETVYEFSGIPCVNQRYS